MVGGSEAVAAAPMTEPTVMKASGSIVLTNLRITADSRLRQTTMTIFECSFEYQPCESMSVTPRWTFCAMASAIFS